MLGVVNTDGACGADHTQVKDDVLLLSIRLLHNVNGELFVEAQMVYVNIRKFSQGEQQELQPLATAKHRAAEQPIAKNVHKQLQRSNVTRVTRALEPAQVAQPTPQIM
jgi:hypothetical protein